MTAINAIGRPDNHLVPHLVDGWHRLEAVRRLGWQEVPCCTLESDDVQAEVNEIDENLMRADLSPGCRDSIEVAAAVVPRCVAFSDASLRAICK
jgi:hypothetical protein